MMDRTERLAQAAAWDARAEEWGRLAIAARDAVRAINSLGPIAEELGVGAGPRTALTHAARDWEHMAEEARQWAHCGRRGL